MLESGCLNCKERYLGCHGSCERYKKYKDRLNLIKENKIKEKEKYQRTKRAI